MINNILSYSNYNSGYINRGQSFRGSASLSKKFLNIDYKSIDKNSADYILYSYKYTKALCKNLIAEVNVESERLLDIVKDKQPCIFIMNHTSSQMKDILAAKFFNTLLYREYIYHDMAASCPRSKVLSGAGVLKHQADEGKLYSWLGVTHIKTDYANKDAKEYNKKQIHGLSDQLAKGEINLFLFPEGVFAAIPFVPLEYKFQPGCASIIKRVLDSKDHIKVVPIGFAHNKKSSAIHIGEPVFVYNKSGKYSITRGNICENLYPGMSEIALTEKGIPVDREHVVPYISGMLAENLKVCTKNAKSDLKNSKGDVFKL